MNYDYTTTSSSSPASDAMFSAVGIGLLLAYLVFMVLIYVYTSLCLQAIAKKLGSKNGWWAWIPILNVLLMFELAGKPLWWFLLLFIPLVNIVIAVIAWMEIAKRRGKSAAYGILMLLPLINFICMGILAFSNSSASTPAQAQPPMQPPMPPQQPQPPRV